MSLEAKALAALYAFLAEHEDQMWPADRAQIRRAISVVEKYEKRRARL